MNIFKKDDYKEFENFTNKVETVKLDINDYAKESDIAGIEKFLSNFKLKTEDFSRENRKLNIGVVGQVKAGKSSFLNTLLFDGKEIFLKHQPLKLQHLLKWNIQKRMLLR